MARINNFKGGIFLRGEKSTAKLGIETMPVPRKVVLHLSQHAGLPSSPVVKKGSYVFSGQLVAEAGGNVSSPLHSSISGTVREITEWTHPVTGLPGESIIVESDGRDDRSPDNKNFHEYFRFSPAEIINVVRDAGVVGLGGGAFPTHIKLSLHKKADIRTLIINGAESEPYLSSDDRLMREYSKDIIEGAKIMMYVLDAVKAIIAVEDNKPQAVKELAEIIFNEPNIDLAVLKTRYPQGSEKQLVKTILNKEVPSSGLPFNVGAVVQNVATAYAVAKAVKEGENLTSRVITVAGKGIREPKNIRVRIGTLLADIAEFCGGATADLGQVIMGGPMTGVVQPTLKVPVLKCTTGVLFFSKQETIDRNFSDCFRCGKCSRVCPMGLLPGMLSAHIEKGRVSEAEKYYPSDCIECGCCAYVCPARRPIVEQIRTVKQQILNTKL
ncbi:MAG: electron transport complex subunit RsxC [Elusimicrobiota bacterium]